MFGLDTVHRPGFYLQCNVSRNGFWLRIQVKTYSLGPKQIRSHLNEAFKKEPFLFWYSIPGRCLYHTLRTFLRNSEIEKLYNARNISKTKYIFGEY